MPEPEESINTDATVVPPSSLGGKLMNIFVAPTEVFDEVKARPHQATNWLVPIVLCMIMGIIYTMVVFSLPQVMQGIHEAQEKAIQENVTKGKMTQQQADQGLAMAEKFTSPAVMKTFGIIGTIIIQSIVFLLTSSLLWLIANFAMKRPVEYLKFLEVVGLTSILGIPDTIIRMLLAMIYGNASMSPGPVLLVGHYDPQNKWHMALAFMDVFLFWQIGLWALGLARLSGGSYTKSLVWLLVCIGCIVGVFVGIMLLLSKMLASLGGK